MTGRNERKRWTTGQRTEAVVDDAETMTDEKHGGYLAGWASTSACFNYDRRRSLQIAAATLFRWDSLMTVYQPGCISSHYPYSTKNTTNSPIHGFPPNFVKNLKSFDIRLCGKTYLFLRTFKSRRRVKTAFHIANQSKCPPNNCRRLRFS